MAGARGDGTRRVAMFAPMPMELEPLVAALDLSQRTVGDLTVWERSLGDVIVTATTTGIGPAAATAAATRLLEALPADEVMVVGIAGGLPGRVQVGDLVVPERVVDGASGEAYDVPARAGLERRGMLATSADFLVEPAALTALASDGFVAIDMESAAVALVAQRAGAPCWVFRGISDMAGDETVGTEVFALAKPDGSADHDALRRYLDERPERAERLAGLARDSVAAAARAAHAAVALCT
jgi:nucleoside phosphorylase